MMEHGGYQMPLPVILYVVVSLFFVIAAVWALLLLWGIQKKASACAKALEDIRDRGFSSL